MIPHHLRFIQALVLAASLPACSDAAVETNEPTDPAQTSEHAQAPRTMPSATASTEDASVDSGLPHLSGPIVPPELTA
jgi:hypothetical protein